MHFKAIVRATLIGLILTSCGTRDEYGNRFSGPDEIIAFHQSEHEKLLASIQPLPRAIAGPAVLVTPTANDLYPLLKSAGTGQSEESIRKNAGFIALEGNWLREHLIKRNLFTAIELRHTTNSPAVALPETYLIEVVYGFDGEHIYIQAPGVADRSELPRLWYKASSYNAAISGEIRAIEDYVRAHTPQ